MSTRHNTLARLLAWAKAHALILLAAGATLALVVVVFAVSFRLYDSRRAEVAAIKALTAETRGIVAHHEEQDRALCEQGNDTNATVRFILDAGLRLRAPDNPISPELREAYIDAYSRLSHTDCATGAKRTFAPPFQPGHVPPE